MSEREIPEDIQDFLATLGLDTADGLVFEEKEQGPKEYISRERFEREIIERITTHQQEINRLVGNINSLRLADEDPESNVRYYIQDDVLSYEIIDRNPMGFDISNTSNGKRE